MPELLGTPILGVDEAWDKATPAELIAAGYHWVGGYVSQNRTGKNLTRAQIDNYHSHGLAVVLFGEYDPRRGLSGWGGGVEDAHLWGGYMSAMNVPSGVCLYAAIDFDVNTQDLMACLQYLNGFTRTMHGLGWRGGSYGGYLLTRAALDAKVVDLAAQTYAWSDQRWDTRVAIRQEQNGIHVAGHNLDRDSARLADFGAWYPPHWSDGTPTTGDGHVTEPQQIADIHWANTHEPDPDHPGQSIPLQVWADRVNARLAALTGLAKTTDHSVTLINQALTTLNASLHDILTGAAGGGGLTGEPTPLETRLVTAQEAVAAQLAAIAGTLRDAFPPNSPPVVTTSGAEADVPVAEASTGTDAGAATVPVDTLP